MSANPLDPFVTPIPTSLRDYFAAHALAMLASDGLRGAVAAYQQVSDPDVTGDQATARFAYSVADAMLAERAKGGTQ
jgi:hypothetical protein